KDSENAQEWIEMFLRVKEANGWPDNRRVAIAAGMLREEAADWYNL
ncbi:16016_t:CDS:1, partial [Funneliformis mosseae]